MPTKQLKDSGKNTPRKKFRVGRFQISTWVFRRLLTNAEKDSTIYLERWVDVERACIQYSTYNKATGQWENQAIWCPVDDRQNLAKVLDQLNEEDPSPSVEEDGSSSPSSHHEENNEDTWRQRDHRAYKIPFI